MKRPLALLRDSGNTFRGRLVSVTSQSDRDLLLGFVLLASAFSAALGFILAQYFAVDVLSSLTFFPEDCWGNWETKIGRHCFGDYAMVAGAGTRPNPYLPYPLLPPHQPVPIGGPAAGFLPALIAAFPAKWMGVPLVGLTIYLLALTIAVLTPAVWASRGARGLEQIVIFVALSAAAIPAWAVIDRGNSTGFAVPIALVYFIALCRQRWGLVASMVILAALVKPQFAVLVVVLFAARQWRWGVLSLAGVGVTNIAAYLLWPQLFPGSITQSIRDLSSVSSTFTMLVDARNVSFGKGLLLIPDSIKMAQMGGKIPDGFLAGPRAILGYIVLLLLVGSLLLLGRRIPPIMAGIVLLVTAEMSPPLALFYHLTFALPIAALLIRDPTGPPGTGLFDQDVGLGRRRRAIGICLVLATTCSIVQIPLPASVYSADIPGQGAYALVGTTTGLAPLLWLAACAVIVVSYARNKPTRSKEKAGRWRDESNDSDAIAVGADE